MQTWPDFMHQAEYFEQVVSEVFIKNHAPLFIHDAAADAVTKKPSASTAT